MVESHFVTTDVDNWRWKKSDDLVKNITHCLIDFFASRVVCVVVLTKLFRSFDRDVFSAQPRV